MKRHKGQECLQSTRIQESADSLLAEAMKLPGVTDYFSVYGEYQKLEASAKAYFTTLHPIVSWNTSDTTTL